MPRYRRDRAEMPDFTGQALVRALVRDRTTTRPVQRSTRWPTLSSWL
ncbi:hypothetical protein AS9A_3486 [Hoyosella subflava DQS3-9A1]|uniref:Uncharacterized protein n=1 Tax=Hoyosella subflava (strain DSM 45089 / JCM 17490 / NBRC 109087 / DQS3-9A1) TaxID=443218 RepID=F6EQP9_HOYSD|nr:hypothetical protein AS9A_3486 [Hoyosella subflava DQS3-9A1]